MPKKIFVKLIRLAHTDAIREFMLPYRSTINDLCKSTNISYYRYHKEGEFRINNKLVSKNKMLRNKDRVLYYRVDRIN